MTNFFSELEEQEAAREEAAKKEREFDRAIDAALSTAEGREVLLWILRGCGTLESTTRMDETETLCASVRRDVGLQILWRCRRASKAWAEFLLKELGNGK